MIKLPIGTVLPIIPETIAELSSRYNKADLQMFQQLKHAEVIGHFEDGDHWLEFQNKNLSLIPNPRISVTANTALKMQEALLQSA